MKQSKTYLNTGGLSVVVPAYNAENWLEPTIGKIKDAINFAGIVKYEIIVVEDGSTDKTKDVASRLHDGAPEQVILISKPNEGRFLTRKKGVEAARYETVLFVDTRVWIDPSALHFVADQFERHPDRRVWNGHVNVAKKGNVIARFGDAITFIGWRRYFKRPSTVSYTHKDFDYYPKGTGMFMVPRQIIFEAIDWFMVQTIDTRYSSDDTLLIRHIAEKEHIWLSPEFSCTYFARTNLQAFIKHSYHRGQFFVDGFLRHGTRFFYPLIAFFILTPVLVLSLLLVPSLYLLFLGLAIATLILELLIALMLGVYYKDALSLVILTPVFAVVYGLGIWRGLLRKIKTRQQ